MRVIRNSSIYLGSEVIKRGIAFLLLPILTRFMSPEEYGTLSMFTAYVGFAMPVIAMSMPLHISRNFFKVDKLQIAQIIHHLTISLAINSVFAILVLAIVNLTPWHFFHLPVPWLFIVLLIVATDTIMQLNLSVLRNRGQAIHFGLFQIVRITIELSVSLLLVVQFYMSWQGRVIGVAVGAFLVGIYSMFYLRKTGYVAVNFSRAKLAEIYKLSLPMIPHLLAGMMITFSGRFFLDAMESRTVVGLYAVGFTFASIIGSLDQAFILAFSPWLYKSMASPNPILKARMVRYTYIYAAGIIAAALLLGICGPWLVSLLTAKSYQGADAYVFWIAMGFACQAIYKAITPYIINQGKTQVLAVLTLITALFCLLFNYGCIKMFGPIGSAYAVALSMFLKLVLVFWYSNRIYPMPWLLINKPTMAN